MFDAPLPVGSNAFSIFLEGQVYSQIKEKKLISIPSISTDYQLSCNILEGEHTGFREGFISQLLYCILNLHVHTALLGGR